MAVGLHSGSELGMSQAAYLHLAAATPNMTLAIDTGYPSLVDDVITTGATVAESVRVLAAAGIQVDLVVVLAAAD